MRVTTVSLRDFRNYHHAGLELSPSLTVIAGPNGSGKTNLLEAIYVGCTGGSPRTATERELVRRGADVARVTVAGETADGRHEIEIGLALGEPKAIRVDGSAVDSLSTSASRPLVSVFLPDRLVLVKGAPASRRAHLDHLVAALWPGRAGTRAAYSRALAQRNALLGRVRSGAATPASLGSWETELAGHGVQLMADRREAVALVAPAFEAHGSRLGLPAVARLRYRPRSGAADAAALAEELHDRRSGDVERGFTAHGPHRDDLQLLHGEEPLRSFGSQGQQRLALLALLFAERDMLAEERGRPPLMLLDDVMSELDPDRRERLAELLLDGGQALVTTTELGQVPGTDDAGVAVVVVADAQLVPRPVAA